MNIEFAELTYSLRDNDSVFQFTEPVFNYVLGIRYFKLMFNNGSNHHVKELALGVSSSLFGGGRYIRVQVRGALSDTSGNMIDWDQSKVVIVCLAVTGGFNNNIQLANLPAIDNHFQIRTPTWPSTRIGIASGFRLECPKDDHKVREVTFGATANAHSMNTATLDGWASMRGDSNGSDWTNDWSGSAEVDGGLIALSRSVDNIVFAYSSSQDLDGTGTMNFSHDIPKGKTLSSGVAMIQSFRAVFPRSERAVSAIGGGCGPVSTKDGYMLVFDSPGAFITDNEGHNQDNNVSHANLVLLGLLAST